MFWLAGSWGFDSMVTELYQWLPADGVKILLVLFLSFLIGLEREERKAKVDHYTFGGVRTYPLIGLIAFALAFLAKGQFVPVTVGFVVISGFLMLSYSHKLSLPLVAGVTSEMSGLATYLVGALVYYDHFWIATTLSVASVILLELKAALENITNRIDPDEVLTFTKFLLLTAVILPILPNKPFGLFQINPFTTWMVVVATSSVSYGSYVLQRMTKGQGGVILAALLGGAYSSTFTTVVLARRSSQENRPHLFAGGILIASGIMYLRFVVLVGLFNRTLMMTLAPTFLVLAGLGVLVGWLWSRRRDPGSDQPEEFEPKNPLELGTAILFAFLFVILLVATQLATSHLGQAGVYSLAAIVGVTNVDPFIMGMTQTAGKITLMNVAAASILITAASNNIVKGIYAYAMSRRPVGVPSLFLLLGLAAAGLVPLLWIAR